MCVCCVFHVLNLLRLLPGRWCDPKLVSNFNPGVCLPNQEPVRERVKTVPRASSPRFPSPPPFRPRELKRSVSVPETGLGYGAWGIPVGGTEPEKHHGLTRVGSRAERSTPLLWSPPYVSQNVPFLFTVYPSMVLRRCCTCCHARVPFYLVLFAMQCAFRCVKGSTQGAVYTVKFVRDSTSSAAPGYDEKINIPGGYMGSGKRRFAPDDTQSYLPWREESAGPGEFYQDFGTAPVGSVSKIVGAVFVKFACGPFSPQFMTSRSTRSLFVVHVLHDQGFSTTTEPRELYNFARMNGSESPGPSALSIDTEKILKPSTKPRTGIAHRFGNGYVRRRRSTGSTKKRRTPSPKKKGTNSPVRKSAAFLRRSESPPPSPL